MELIREDGDVMVRPDDKLLKDFGDVIPFNPRELSKYFEVRRARMAPGGPSGAGQPRCARPRGWANRLAGSASGAGAPHFVGPVPELALWRSTL